MGVCPKIHTLSIMKASCFICNLNQFCPEETKLLLCFSQKSHNSENVSGDTVMLVRIAGKITSLTRCRVRQGALENSRHFNVMMWDFKHFRIVKVW